MPWCRAIMIMVGWVGLGELFALELETLVDLHVLLEPGVKAPLVRDVLLGCLDQDVGDILAATSLAWTPHGGMWRQRA